jgi:hypothetical protein
MGDYKDSPTLTPDLPTIETDPDDGSGSQKPFRYGSRPKFRHE